MPTRSVIQKPRATRGKTVGRAVIKSYIHDYLHGQDADFKPLYTQGRFNAMVEGIQSDHEYSIYLQYVALHNGLAEELVRSQAYAQQAQHGLAHLQSVLADVRRAETQDALFAQLTALYGLPLDTEEADALCTSMRGLFFSIGLISGSAENQANIHSYRTQLLLPALRGLSAYNTLVSLLAQGLEFPDLLELSAPLDDIARDISAYNEEVRMTGALLSHHEELFHALFPPLSAEAHMPSPEAVSAAREAIAAPSGLQTGTVQQLFIRLLEATP